MLSTRNGFNEKKMRKNTSVEILAKNANEAIDSDHLNGEALIFP